MYKVLVCMLLLGLTVGQMEVAAADISQNPKWNSLNNEYLDLKEQTDKLGETLKDNKKNYQALHTQMKRDEAKLASLEVTLQESEEQLKKDQQKAKKIEGNGSSSRYFDFLFHSYESNFFVRTGTGFGEVKKQNAFLDTYQSQKKKAKQLKKQMKQLDKKVQAIRVEMEGNHQVIEEQEAVESSLLAELAAKKEMVDQFDQTKIDQKGKDIKAAEAAFGSPAKGQITSTYGYRDGVMKTGLIIKNKSKESVPVLSIAEGVVTKSYFSNSQGNVIHIQHQLVDTLYETVYTHLNLRTVKVNDSVDRGTLIGIMGDTGTVSGGKQLHFKMFETDADTQKQKNVNPLLYFSVSNS